MNQDTQNLSLSKYLTAIQRVVKASFGTPIWVCVEASEVKTARQGHIYFNFVEHDDSGREVAKCNGVLWASRAKSVVQKFSASTGGDLRPGLKLLVQVAAEFHPQYGFSLQVLDVDPSYTLGDMEQKLAKIRDILKKEGVFDRNKQLPKPLDFRRVAVIAPEGAAGLGDFRQEADRLGAHGVVEFMYYSALFQGVGATESISTAFSSVLNDHAEDPFDAVCLIRGGGAKTDLAWLNELAIAKLICSSPIPVFSGIGHERDNVILDEVAHTRFDTPSKVAAHIFGAVVENVRAAIGFMQNIVQGARALLNTAQVKISDQVGRVRMSANHALEKKKLACDQALQDAVGHSERHLERAQQNIEAWIREIIGLGPRKTLQRGFVIARTSDGRAISSAKAAGQQSELRLEFFDGQVIATPINEQ